MNSVALVSYIPYVGMGVALLVLLVILGKLLVNVGAREIAIQADVLKPGLHFFERPFEKVGAK